MKVELKCGVCDGTGISKHSNEPCRYCRHHNGNRYSRGFLGKKQKEVIRRMREGEILVHDIQHSCATGNYLMPIRPDEDNCTVLPKFYGWQLGIWGIINYSGEKIETGDDIMELSESGKAIEL